MATVDNTGCLYYLTEDEEKSVKQSLWTHSSLMSGNMALQESDDQIIMVALVHWQSMGSCHPC